MLLVNPSSVHKIPATRDHLCKKLKQVYMKTMLAGFAGRPKNVRFT